MTSLDTCYLLQCPVEVRLRIFEHLFHASTICIEQDRPQDGEEGVGPQMRRVAMSSQILRTCRKLHLEGAQILYGGRCFDCSQREGMKLLLQYIGSGNFSLIRHIKTDWDELQQFSWALTREQYQLATRGLICLEMATWRTKFATTSAFLWKQVKGYERQLYQSASDICRKHQNLNYVVERRRGFKHSSRGVDDARVNWRFISSINQCLSGETMVPLEAELRQMEEDQQDDDRDPNLIIDAF